MARHVPTALVSGLFFAAVCIGAAELAIAQEAAPTDAAPTETATTELGGTLSDEPDPEAELKKNPEWNEFMAAAERPSGTVDPGESLPSFGAALLQMVLMFGAVCLLAYLVLGKGLPRLMRIEAPRAPQRIIRVVDRLPIDQRRSLMIVKMADQHWLIGVTEQGISMLSRLEAEEVEGAIKAAEADRPSIGRLAGALVRRSQKES